MAFARSLKLDESLTLDSPAAKVVAGSFASSTSKVSGQQLQDDKTLRSDSPAAKVPLS